MKDERLQQEAENASIPNYMKTKLDAVEYYKDTYGEKNWRSHMTRDILHSLGLPETKKNLNTYGRDIQAGREYTASRRADIQARYEKLGQQLPPVDRTPKKSELTITIDFQENSRGRTKDRSKTITMSGMAAYDFVNNPDYDMIWDEYGIDAETADEYFEVTGVAVS